MCATNACADCLDKKTGESVATLKQDLLAKAVSSHRAALELWQVCSDAALANPKIRMVMESSQPTHLLAAVAVGLVSSTIYGGGQGSHHRPSSVIPAIYLISVALHFGAQFWMTFVSGLSLYFSLSRHAFGDVQQVLFPRYFTLNSLFSCVTLLSFAKLHNHLDSWNMQHYSQACCIGVGFLVEALARLYMTPRVLLAMTQVRQLELQVDGVGKEVGRHIPGSLSTSPAYVTAYSTFRKAHSCMAVANLTSMSCTIAHLIYLASTINFS